MALRPMQLWCWLLVVVSAASAYGALLLGEIHPGGCLPFRASWYGMGGDVSQAPAACAGQA